MNNNKKQALILSIVAVVTLIALVVGATFAYFKAQGGTGSSTEVKVTTYTTDMLTFTTGSAISLYADQSSFGQEKGSLSGETFAKATLVANNKTNEATDNYYVYFNIENNTFKYTLGNDKPELILTVTGPDGNEVTSLPGLTHTTVQDRENKSISGFDVTTTNGLITIANKKTITATTDAKEEQYTLKLTFVNYEGDQTANATSSLSAKVMIQKEPIVTTTLADYVKSLYVSNNGENSIYYHDGTIRSTTEFTIFNNYDGEVVYPVGTVLDAGDNSYRYAGANPNNYICINSSVTPCPSNNLYRIIGVIDEKVKVIKNRPYYMGAQWDNNGNNIWSSAWINNIINDKKNMAKYIGEEFFENKIAMTTWKVGGNTEYNIASTIPSLTYQNEIVNPATTSTGETEYSAKIGLMYVSDYGFAAAPSAWTTNLYNYDDEAIKSANWMFQDNSDDLTITRMSDSTDQVFEQVNGKIYSAYSSGDANARLVFNLINSVTYVEGDGTQSSPIRIN